MTYSIKKEGEVVLVIDHSCSPERKFAPSCGEDALAHYNYLSGSLKSGCGEVEAQKFLASIMNNESPVTDMIKSARSGVKL